MDYTVNELERLDFPTRWFGGYDRREVDRFVDDIASQTEDMVERIAEREREAEELNSKLKQYEKLEDSIKETLAQQTREERVAQANREAEEILREARRKEREVRMQINSLEANRDQFAVQFYALLRGFASQLASQFPELMEDVPEELDEPPVDAEMPQEPETGPGSGDVTSSDPESEEGGQDDTRAEAPSGPELLEGRTPPSFDPDQAEQGDAPEAGDEATGARRQEGEQ